MANENGVNGEKVRVILTLDKGLYDDWCAAAYAEEYFVVVHQRGRPAKHQYLGHLVDLTGHFKAVFGPVLRGEAYTVEEDEYGG